MQYAMNLLKRYFFRALQVVLPVYFGISAVPQHGYVSAIIYGFALYGLTTIGEFAQIERMESE